MLILAIYGLAFLNSEGEQSPFRWVPNFSIYLFTAMSTIGYLIIPWVMIGELYPTKVNVFLSKIIWVCKKYYKCWNYLFSVGPRISWRFNNSV